MCDPSLWSYVVITMSSAVHKYIGHQGGGSKSVNHGDSTVCDASGLLLGKKDRGTVPLCHNRGIVADVGM